MKRLEALAQRIQEILSGTQELVTSMKGWTSDFLSSGVKALLVLLLIGGILGVTLVVVGTAVQIAVLVTIGVNLAGIVAIATILYLLKRLFPSWVYSLASALVGLVIAMAVVGVAVGTFFPAFKWGLAQLPPPATWPWPIRFETYSYLEPGLRNGNFDEGLTGWLSKGEVSLVDQSYNGEPFRRFVAEVGRPVPPDSYKVGETVLEQVFLVPLDASVLEVEYRVVTNDIADYTAFYVRLTSPGGVILTQAKGGYDPPDRVAKDYNDLGWQTAELDISPFRGEKVKLQLVSRNEWAGARGIWAYVRSADVIK